MERADGHVGGGNSRHPRAEAKLVIEQYPHRVAVIRTVIRWAACVRWRQFPIGLTEISSAVVGIHVRDKLHADAKFIEPSWATQIEEMVGSVQIGRPNVLVSAKLAFASHVTPPIGS